MTMAANTARPHTPSHKRDGFMPKLVTMLMQGYRFQDLRADAVAGITVAIVALPLSMALAIASGASPDKGLVTVVVAGLLISVFGGSRYQIGGPTGAFVVVVFNVIAQHGYDGLVIATLMAGIILAAAGFAKLGNFMRYIPEPVVTGFTAGIAVIIFSSQVKDFFGLSLSEVPADFLPKWEALIGAMPTFSSVTTVLSVGALALILVLRRVAPKVPGFLLVVVIGAALVPLLHLPVDTIGTRFGGLHGAIPAPHWPQLTMARVWELLPSALTIAFLAGVESLLSAVVADGMSGGRHRPNAELVAQGIANSASALFGGLPATGAIARTATNIRAGARSPMAGVLHAIFVLAVMLALAPLAANIPLASLAAILMVVAWNMSEVDRFRHLLSAPMGDRILLLSTFILTVAVDLTVAIATGVVLAAVLFMHRMAETASVGPAEYGEGEEEEARSNLPEGVEIFQVNGPLFFGAAARFSEVLENIGQKPRVFILDMDQVPLMDSTGVNALSSFARHCANGGTQVVVAGLKAQPRRVLEQMSHDAPGASLTLVSTLEQALAMARAKAAA